MQQTTNSTHTYTTSYSNKQTTVNGFVITTVAVNGTLGDYDVNENTITITLTADTTNGYTLPASISIKIGSDAVVVDNSTYYDSSTGEITIIKVNITGNVQISAVCTKQN